MDDSKFEESDKEEEYMPRRMNDPTSSWQGFYVTDLSTEHVDSDEYDSDYICSESSEDEDEPTKVRGDRRCYKFNEDVDMRDPKFVISIMFPTRESFNRALKEYSIVKHRSKKLVKNGKGRVRVKCSDGCSWTVYASIKSNDFSFEVNTLNAEHTCGLDFSSKRINSWLLAKRYLNQWRANPTSPFFGFKQLELDDLRVDVTEWYFYRARKYVIQIIEGLVTEQYANL